MNKSFDKVILFCLIGLSLFSTFNLLGIKPSLLPQQLLFIVIGFIVMVLFYKLDVLVIRANSRLMYGLFVTALVLTALFAPQVRGSARWLDFNIIRFQPSEFFRPFFLSFLAHLFARKARSESGSEIVKSLLVSVIPIALILHQPDLGNAILYIVIFLAILYYVGISVKFFVGVIIFGIISSPIIWTFLHDYQRLRIISFLNPTLDPQGISYNLFQSIITIGSGGFWGKGMGLGTQSRFLFLPEFHTDFAFASLIEQFGLFGGVLILLFFGLIIYRFVRKAFSKRNNLYSFLFLMGTSTILFASVFVNVGMNLGLLPVTGVALPLISYGGASIISTFILLGLAMAL